MTSKNSTENTLDILAHLIGFNTINAHTNLAIIDWIEGFLKIRGFECHRVLSPCGNKAGLYAMIGPKHEAGIMLSGHTDVVPTQGQDWTVDPFKLTKKNDHVYGRGTTDMKGFLACMLTAADSASKAELKQPLKLAFSYDEEIGCVGIAHMIDELESAIGFPQYCIVGEPTSMTIATGHKGKSALRAKCYGVSGHSAMAPEFSNALHLGVDFVVGLRGLQNELAHSLNQDYSYSIPYSTVHVGKMQGGVALNIVPDFTQIDFEFRHLAQDNPNDILKKINSVANDITLRAQTVHSAAKVEIETINSYPGLSTDENSEVVEFVSSLLPQPKLTKVSFGTEAGFFSNLGIPTIVCGPGSMEQGHKPDEFIKIEELKRCDQMMKNLIATMQ